jgi:antitoxin HicB
MKYPARFTRDLEDGGYVVTFRDIPEAITQGDTLDEAMLMAADALVTAMDFYFEDKRAVPHPSKPKRGEKFVELPASVTAKIHLLNAMLDSRVKHSELARRLNMPQSEINRLIDLHHATKIDRIAEALKALGKKLEVSVS